MVLSMGIIGAGGIAELHAETLQAHDNADLTGVCDVDAGRARTFATSFHADPFTDHQTMFRAFDLDGVYITTPPQTRIDIIRDAAEHGIAVFCEKPIATTVSNGREIRDIVEEYEIPFMVGFCLRFTEPCQRMGELLAEGDIGEPITMFSNRAGYGVPQGKNWRIDPDQACGITVESASHNIDLLRWLGGEVESASGRTTNVSHPDIDMFDDNLLATMRFEDGPIGLVQNSWTSHIEYLRHGVIGTEGAVLVDGDGWWRLDRLTYATETDEYPTTITFDSATATDMGYVGETDAFLESVATGTTPTADVYDGLRVLEISHEILSG